jgi:carboxyl-terminal processing protease
MQKTPKIPTVFMKIMLPAMALVAGMAFVGCKKNKEDVPDNPPPVQSTKLKDSTLFYAREIYLWYKNIPSGFNAGSYADPGKIMEAIRPYSIEGGFTSAVDRWSFAVTKAEWDGVSSGISGDFGLGVFFLSNSDLRVSYVERESPAGKAGIKRSWRIKQINGNSNITTSNASFIVNAVYSSPSSVFVFTKPDGTDVTLPLAAATYREHPVFFDSVYTTGSTKTGYFVFNSFLGDTTEMYSEFSRIFNTFSAANVQDVVVDLRYNGGGYVAVQNVLANYLVPNAGNGGVMEVQQYNDKYKDWNETVTYKKIGSLNLPRLFVIVSQNTASASELLINSLKPYMNVQLVGPSATHGKPVGFFPIPVYDWYIFPVSFRTVNKNGEGNYFNGLALNNQVMDGLDKAWGDPAENCLASTLRYITNGSYARVAVSDALRQGLTPEVQNGNTSLGAPKFKGTISNHRIGQ